MLQTLIPDWPKEQLRKRLADLYHHGYVDRPPYQSYFLRHPDESWELIYACTNKGLAAIELHPKTRYDTKNKTLSPLFMRHRLGINCFHIALVQALKSQPQLTLAFWYGDGEWYSLVPEWHPSLQRSTQVKLYPDAFANLYHQSRSADAFIMLEWDTGTEDLTRLLQKCQRYVTLTEQQALRSPQSPHRPIKGFRVLIIMDTAVRQDHLLTKIKAADLKKKGMFLVTTAERIDFQTSPEQLLTAPIWQVWETLKDTQGQTHVRLTATAFVE
jgi:hypothetical protein